MKKILALVIAMLLVLGMTSAFAAPTTNNTLKITNTGKTAHTFELYQIIIGDLSTDGKTLSNVSWGSGVADSFKTDANMTTLKALEGTATDGAEIKAFADLVAANLSTTKVTSTEVAASGSYTFEGLTSGYYLVKDTINSQDNAVEGAYTQYIVNVVGTVEVNTKLDIPSVEKKVDDKVDSDTSEDTITWQDSADYDIGDSVPFQVKGTLPSNYAEYSTYYYEFSDEMSAGLTYNEDAKVYAAIGNNWYDITTGFDLSGAVGSIKVSNLKAITSGNLVTFDSTDTQKIASTATEASAISIDKDTVIYVRYSATLNENATVLATGNPNTVKLIYSNNPEGDGHGETKPDKVTVFTFLSVVDKVEQDGDALTEEQYNALSVEDQKAYKKIGDKYYKYKALTGAAFTIYKKVVDSNVTGAKLGSAIKAELTASNSAIEASALDNNTYYVTKAMTANGANHSLKGLDAGDYVIVETTIPNGFNAYNSKAFTITATHDTNSSDPQLLTLEGGDPLTVVDKPNGKLSGTIENNKGSTLPSTGGIGTTLFYVAGSILVLAAVIFMVTKRRMNANND